MLRKRILFLRRKISISCKFLNRWRNALHALLQVRQDPKKKSIHIKSMVLILLAITAFLLLYFTTKDTTRIQDNFLVDFIFKKNLKTYDQWRMKLFAMLKANDIRSFEYYKKMLKNNIKSQRIKQIIEEESKDLNDFEERQCVMIKPDCPSVPPDLRGKLPVKSWMVGVKKKKLRDQNNYTFPIHPGVWSPRQCTSRHSVAIIIPYRNRDYQLHLLLQHLPPILKRQQISYSIFVVEQEGNNIFNKGIVMNAGFLIALSRPAHGVTYHCFIFHDADLLAEDDRSMYTCPEFPRHISLAVDELDYKLPYHELVGGVFAIKTDHFMQVNGYSNSYWGWGGEDDDMGLRVGKVLKWILRPQARLGRYTTIPHVKQTPLLAIGLRRHLKKTTKKRYRNDGLNSVKFTLKQVVQKRQFTHVVIDVGNPPQDYRQLIKSGYKELKRTLVQQLMERLEHWQQKHSRIPRKFKESELLGHIPEQGFGLQSWPSENLNIQLQNLVREGKFPQWQNKWKSKSNEELPIPVY